MMDRSKGYTVLQKILHRCIECRENLKSRAFFDNDLTLKLSKMKTIKVNSKI